MPTSQNPAHLGSVAKNHLWREGPTWLSNRSEWPAVVALEATAETRAEAKVKREILAVTSVERDEFDQLLDKYDLFKVLRIGAWIQRFIGNCRTKPRERASGPLVTDEIQRTKSWWTKRAQLVARQDSRFEADQLHLNLQPNDEGILECRGRIHGEFPIYLPDNHPYTSSLVRQAHVSTLHGAVGMTMAKIREHHWVLRLCQLVKKIRSKCQGCKRFQTKAFQAPPPGKLPSSRTQGTAPFQVFGVNFAGPIKYHDKGEDLRKRASILKNCKSAMWKRWSREYVRSLREQHRNLWRNGQSYPKIGDVVIVHDEDQPRNRWKLAIVTRLITGKDNIIRGAVLKTGKGTIERAVQHLHPLELSCDR